MEFRIKHTWDGLPVSHEPVTIGLRPDNVGLLMEVHAPFFNDPPAPPGEPGKPFGGLWDYEGKCNSSPPKISDFCSYCCSSVFDMPGLFFSRVCEFWCLCFWFFFFFFQKTSSKLEFSDLS